MRFIIKKHHTKPEPVKEAVANNVDSSLTGQQPLSILDARRRTARLFCLKDFTKAISEAIAFNPAHPIHLTGTHTRRCH
jgi:hypothetical protein